MLNHKCILYLMSISQVADDYTSSAKEMEAKGTGLLVTGPLEKEEHFKHFPNSKKCRLWACALSKAFLSLPSIMIALLEEWLL